MSETHAPEILRDQSPASSIDVAPVGVGQSAGTASTEGAASLDSSAPTPSDPTPRRESPAGAELDESDDDTGAETGHAVQRRAAGSSLRRLEEEGEVAADYLEELLDIVDLDGDIDIDVENGRASVAIVAESGVERDLRRLVGGQGEVLEALQELARLSVQARTGERSRLMLDVGGFRAERRRALHELAGRMCEEVRQSGAAVRLEPMSAFERKVVHDAVADAGLISESEGEEPGRRVVIHPARS